MYRYPQINKRQNSERYPQITDQNKKKKNRRKKSRQIDDT
jgi:hypothetical protein